MEGRRRRAYSSMAAPACPVAGVCGGCEVQVLQQTSCYGEKIAIMAQLQTLSYGKRMFPSRLIKERSDGHRGDRCTQRDPSGEEKHFPSTKDKPKYIIYLFCERPTDHRLDKISL